MTTEPLLTFTDIPCDGHVSRLADEPRHGRR